MKQLISSRNIKVVLAVVLAITCINGIGLNLNDHPIQVPDGTSSPQSKTTSTSSIPDYTGLASVVLSDGSGLDISDLPSETVLSELDSLGRCGTVEMVVTPDTMPAEGERRGSIGMVKPSGWHTVRDDSLDGTETAQTGSLAQTGDRAGLIGETFAIGGTVLVAAGVFLDRKKRREQA